MLTLCKQLYNALRYSLDGFNAVRQERAFKQELIAIALVAPAFFYFSFTYLEVILLISSLVLILIAEVMNTAVEAAIDRFSQEVHPLSKVAKDCGSLAVLLSIMNAMMVWGVILYQHI